MPASSFFVGIPSMENGLLIKKNPILTLFTRQRLHASTKLSEAPANCCNDAGCCVLFIIFHQQFVISFRLSCSSNIPKQNAVQMNPKKTSTFSTIFLHLACYHSQSVSFATPAHSSARDMHLVERHTTRICVHRQSS